MTFSLRLLSAALLLAVGLVSAAGCSDTPSSDHPAAASAPEDQRVSSADVAAGLAKINKLAKDIIAAGAGKAQGLIDQIEPTWQQIEGTIKANDQGAYLALEDSFAQLGKAVEGDVVTAARGAATVAATVAAYLAKYPG